MEPLHQAFEHSSDAVLGLDGDGKIRFCNERFRHLLGYDVEDISGVSCHRLMCGTDLQGRKFCQAGCPIPRGMSTQGETSEGIDLFIRRSTGESIMVNIGVCYAEHDSGSANHCYLAIRHVDCQRLITRLNTGHCCPGSEIADDRIVSRLTRRETEILRLAADGIDTGHIAERLSISVQTVRNHFKKVHEKLGVHSRAEAVGLALRRHLV